MKTRKPEDVMADISDLLMRSSKDQQIDTGDAVQLLGDAYDVIKKLVR